MKEYLRSGHIRHGSPYTHFPDVLTGQQRYL